MALRLLHGRQLARCFVAALLLILGCDGIIERVHVHDRVLFEAHSLNFGTRLSIGPDGEGVGIALHDIDLIVRTQDVGIVRQLNTNEVWHATKVSAPPPTCQPSTEKYQYYLIRFAAIPSSDSIGDYISCVRQIFAGPYNEACIRDTVLALTLDGRRLDTLWHREQ
jgi:hypothetical protein